MDLSASVSVVYLGWSIGQTPLSVGCQERVYSMDYDFDKALVEIE
jgi:hypothetical protein